MVHRITDLLATAAWETVGPEMEEDRLDVRDLVDKRGNAPATIRRKIDEALARIMAGRKVVICCDYGMSRSNAVAAGVLTLHEKIPFEEAVTRVIEATGERAIRVEVLNAVRQALGVADSVSDPDRSRRALVTGGSGFIGSQVIRLLRARGITVVAPSRHEIDLERDAISLDLAVRNEHAGILLHLANPRVYTTNASLGASLTILKNALDVALEHSLYFVLLSSWEVYSGYRARELWADEDTAPCPTGTYGHARVLGETLFLNYRHRLGLRGVILRSSPVFGPGSEKPRFIWNFLRKARSDHNIVAHNYRNGHPKLDLLYVEDLARAIAETVIRRPGIEAINLGSGATVSTTQVAERLVALLGSKSRVDHVDIDAFSPNIVMDTRRALDALGWQPQVGLDDALRSIAMAECDRHSGG